MYRALVLALAGLALAAPAAGAQAVNAPPGNSGVDEYLETVPGAGGGKPTRGPASQNQDAGKPVLSSSQRKALDQAGADGRAVAQLAQRYGVPRAQRTAAHRKQHHAAGGGGSAADSPKLGTPKHHSALDSVARAVVPSGDSGGMGPLLPIILIATAVLGVGAAVTRRWVR